MTTLDSWLALTEEDPIAPDMPVLDPHHHFWERPGDVYLLEQLLADTGSGHRVNQTVFVECRSMYRTEGPAEMRPVGEVEFVAGIAAANAAAGGATGVAAGIVGYADLMLGDAAAPVLEALASLRDRRAHLVLAHQTLHDLRRTTAELDPEQAAGSVAENCGLKFAYRVHDPDTAQWLARMSGSIRADDELRELETDRLLTERGRGGRALRQTERHLVDANMLQSLPPRCAVLYGDGLAKFAFTSPVPVAEAGGE